MNTTQQLNSSRTENVNYMIITEDTGNNNEERIEVQLAEEDGALNLNSSADSGQLEICLAPRESTPIKNDCKTIQMQQCTTLNSSLPQRVSEHKSFVKNIDELPTSISSRLDIQQSGTSSNNSPHLASIQQHDYNTNNLLQTSETQSKNNGMNSQILSTYDTNLQQQNEDRSHEETAMVSIGPNNTRVPAKFYNSMRWTSASIATRKLLSAIFNRKVLATHSMTGKPSPAFRGHDKPAKQMLDPLIVADIIYAVKINVTFLPRQFVLPLQQNVLTKTKC
ncbi:Protein insensitive [Eumeta japonica]|uniref:Protein insensitive n=1 Tax=Eumeta variegata TaxID=151549 RepID=A0A4C1SK38_EUMVA|nr:Protein insensitive [Eumeta japonica]